VIVAHSLIRRRADIDRAAFNQHWLDPHGPLTAKLPRCLHYVQNHILDSVGTNTLARTLRIDGIPQLAFANAQDRMAAHGSPALKACDKDSELFIGAVSRIITEVDDAATRDGPKGLIKQILLFIASHAGTDQHRGEALIDALSGVSQVLRHRVLQQTSAPGSRVPNLDVPVDGLCELWLSDMDAVQRNAAVLEQESGVASFSVQVHRFI
jgi:uncharacterized protein (TIGR02118 family)